MKFSQRKGIKPVRDAVQRDSIDGPLRNCLWNCVVTFFVDEGSGRRSGEDRVLDKFLRRLWHDFYNWPVDTIPVWYEQAFDSVRKWYMSADWFEVLDFVEYLASEPVDENPYVREWHGNPAAFSEICNNVLEKEMSAYRLSNGQIVEITDENELEEIRSAASQPGKWEPVAVHLRQATALLFDRKAPDYRNAVKEAISAVESACCIITGNRKATLGQALTIVEKTHGLHPAVKDAFSKLYGYTSDGGGIRHGSMEMADVSFEHAKYMLVACSAFVNYLIALSAK